MEQDFAGCQQAILERMLEHWKVFPYFPFMKTVRKNPVTVVVTGFSGGEGEIRTLETLMGPTRFPEMHQQYQCFFNIIHAISSIL